MDSLLEFFDSILNLVVTFPITIYFVLFSTDRLIDLEPTNLVSSPGTTLVISFLIWYTAISLETKIKFAFDLPAMPSKLLLVRVFIVLIIALLIQYIYLVSAYFGAVGIEDTLKIIRALSYPVAVFMTIYSVVYISYLLFPLGSRTHGLSLKERFDSSFREVREKMGTKRIVAEENASFIAFLVGFLAYVYGVYNILREFFDMLTGTAALHTAGLVIVSLVIMALFAIFIFGRYDKLIEKLRSELESMPDGKHKDD